MSKYIFCDDCERCTARAYWANRGTCLVVECMNCEETIASLQAAPPGHASISPGDDPRRV